MSTVRYPAAPVLLVDDEPAWLRALSLALARQLGIDHTVLCSDSREVGRLLAETRPSLAILDVTMPHLSGEELLARIRVDYPELPVIMLTGRNQIDIAVRCMQAGAFDYFVKTVEEERLLAGVRRALQVWELQRENLCLRDGLLHRELANPQAFSGIVTRNPELLGIFRYVEAIAASREPVLLSGESGTGKELAARAIHATCAPQAPLVAVNVAGLDDQMFADTLFGHVRGAYTGAQEARPGMVEKAGNGVLFLDEIGDLSPASQVKLLRLLQEGEYFPVGSDQPRRSHARLVAATNRDLEALQQAGTFRKDLYFRLYAHRIELPPLRRRPEDIPLLLEHFLVEASVALGKRPPTVPPELPLLLSGYGFPGNIRELRAMVIDAVSRCSGGQLGLESFHAAIGATRPAAPASHGAAGDDASFAAWTRLPTLREAGELLVDEALRRSHGNQTMAARLLGITRPALSKRLKKTT